MKRAILIVACLSAFLMTTAATCNEDNNTTVTPKEPEAKEYTCKCTYVPSATGPNAGKPNIDEEEKITAEDLNRAKYDCTLLESKYMPQHYSGSCLIQ